MENSSTSRSTSTKLEVDKKITTCKGEHCINIFISYELKEKISQLAKRYDRTMADVVRTLIKIGIPILESLTEAEEKMLVDYIQVLRRWRKVKELKSREERMNNEKDDNL